MYWRPFKRGIKFLWQRIYRGWDDSDIWSLDFTIAKFIAPRLKLLRKEEMGYPSNMTLESWNADLDKMIAAFEFASSEGRWSAPHKEYDKHQDGINLFAKHFWSLWT